MTKTGIPVLFDGFDIGEAIVSDRGDGVILIDLNDTEVASEVFEALYADNKAISIKPRL